MTPTLPLIIVGAALLVLSIGLAAALSRRSRLLREQIERVAALEEDQERRVREELARRLDLERRQLQREHEARKAESTARGFLRGRGKGGFKGNKRRERG